MGEMREFEAVYWVDKKKGCGSLVGLRKQIAEMGGEHLYDSVYPNSEKDGKIKIIVKYLSAEKLL